MPDYDLIAILGPTASGKTPFAAALAAELNTEIISADSRQIYRSMDLGTGKDLADYIVNGRQVPYHLIDIADPGSPGRARLSGLLNTMEKLSLDNGRLTKETLPMQLNQIARVVLTTAKELFFDPYQTNKATGSFILIDPITNNTSAVGMIIDRVEDKDMHVSEELPVLDLPKLGIAPEHYEAVEKAVKELERQGVAVIIKK